MVNILFVIFLLENVAFDLIVCFKKGYFNLRKSVFIGIILVSIESLQVVIPMTKELILDSNVFFGIFEFVVLYLFCRGYLINLARVVALDAAEKMVYFDEEGKIACLVAARRLRDLKRKLTWQKWKIMLCLSFYYTVQKEARTKNPGLFYLRLRFLKRLWRSSKIRRATKTMATM